MNLLFGIMMLCLFTASIIAYVYGLDRNIPWLIAIGAFVSITVGLVLVIH